MAATAAGRVFVPLALPGETVEAELRGERGAVVSVQSASPMRVEPACPHFGRCGGCALQHADPAFVAEWKRGLVAIALRHRGLQAAVSPTRDAHGAGRRRVTLHLRRQGRSWQAGFMRARSDRLEPVEACPLLAPGLAAAPRLARDLGTVLGDFGSAFDVALTASDTGLDVAVDGTGAAAAAENAEARAALAAFAEANDLARLSLGGEAVSMRRAPVVSMGTARVKPPPGAFLQATAAGEAALAGLVGDALAGAARVADLFAGLGPFALRLGQTAAVHAVDADAQSIAALTRAAGDAGLTRVTAETRDLFRRPMSALELSGFDAVVFDPPRAGAEAQSREIARSSVPLAVAVSCDPATFARDAAILAGGGLEPETVQPVDQFRFAAHVEIVGVFRRRTVTSAGSRPQARRGRRPPGPGSA